jgi:serine/threonine-protein kinase
MDKTLSPPTGQLLDGRYRVESMLARGGMAAVYLGTDTRLDRTVALKIAHPELSGDEEFVRRFIGEARSAAKLSGPNVVAVYDQGSDGDFHYIAMEYVPGLTLRALLDERGRLSPREALDITEGVLTGLAVAHQSGIVHRDVKPENVLLTMASTVKVVDFGLARAAARADHTKAGMIIGTAAYLAPEQVSRSTSDERSDVYAVGVMLFELLTGTQPHRGDTPLAVAYKHVTDIVPPPSTIVGELPPALDALVALATSRDPDLRPADAGHFLLAITEVRRGLPIAGLHSRGQHAAPGSEYVAAAPGGPAAERRAAHAHARLASDGQLHGELPSGGVPGGSLPGGGVPGGSLPGGGVPGGSLPGGGVPGGSLPGGSLPGGSLPGGGVPGGSLPGGSLPSGDRSDGGQPGSGRSDGGQPGSGGASGERPDGRATAGSLTDWPQTPGTASGASSWPPTGHSSDVEPLHGVAVTGPLALSPSSPGEYGPAAELLPSAVVPPADAYRSVNHTLIVAPGGLADGYGDGFDYYQDGAGRGYRRRGEPGLQRWLFSRRLGYIAGALAVLLVVSLAAWWIFNGQYAMVPRLGGIAASTASTELSNLGFAAHAGTGQHSTLPRGDVIRTIPAGGSRARNGSVVTIIESLGPVLRPVPSVTGMPLANAQAALKAAGLTPGQVKSATSTTIAAGIVLATNPVAGVSWPKTKPVEITVSAGPPLADFVGAMLAAAQAAAAAGGYSINPVADAKGTLPAGTITRQSPAANTPISQGEIVTVYYSPGPQLVAVPDVRFMNEDEAVAALTAAGFKVNINHTGGGHTVTDYGPAGQQPAGSTITINVGFPFL